MIDSHHQMLIGKLRLYTTHVYELQYLIYHFLLHWELPHKGGRLPRYIEYV